MGVTRSVLIVSLVLFVSCMAKTYQNEMQRDLDDLKNYSQKIDDRYNNKSEILSDRIKKVQESLDELKKDSSQNKADSGVLIEDLRVELQTLKGNIEENAHKSSLEVQNFGKSLTDLDSRVAELENKFEIILAHLNKLQSILGSKEGQQPSPKETSSSEVSEYDSIVKVITVQKDYRLGAQRLKNFIMKYPSGSLTDNAQYWLAECYYASGDYRTADEEFKRLVREYPTSDKKCAAMLKRSFALFNLDQQDIPEKILRSVVKECPETTEAKLAAEKLSSIERANSNPSKR